MQLFLVVHKNMFLIQPSKFKLFFDHFKVLGTSPKNALKQAIKYISVWRMSNVSDILRDANDLKPKKDTKKISLLKYSRYRASSNSGTNPNIDAI